MKKILLAAMLTSGLMAADSGLYMGVEYGKSTNDQKFTVDSYSATLENDYSDLKFKIGGGTDGDVKFQGTLSMISYTDSIFDSSHKDLMEFGFDVIKEFEVSPAFYPFLKIGLGVGSMDVDGYTDDKILAVSFNLGAGISYKVIDHLYVLAGVDYVGRKWQDIKATDGFSTVTISTTDSGVKPYIGMNYRF